MSVYSRIYDTVRSIPEGKVATYRQIARIVGGCSARQVGYAMAALPDDTDVPWQRVINSKGEISLRKSSDGHFVQRILLEAEGIEFRPDDRIDLGIYGFGG